MKPLELMRDIPTQPGHEAEARLYCRLFLRYLADHVYTAQLNSGAAVHDQMDVKIWLGECAEALFQMGSPVNGPVITISKGAPPGVAAPSWKSEPTCIDCLHVHEGREECKVYLGEGRFCQCETKVRA